MLDGVTLDQLRTFIAAAEQGSFSAAGRKLRRAQSVVSQTLANLEAQLGVQLFDRRNRFPALTTEGQGLLREARAVADHMDAFKAHARSISEGLEEYSFARTRRGLRALLSLAPDQATVLRDGTETVITPGELRIGDPSARAWSRNCPSWWT